MDLLSLVPEAHNFSMEVFCLRCLEPLKSDLPEVRVVSQSSAPGKSHGALDLRWPTRATVLSLMTALNPFVPEVLFDQTSGALGLNTERNAPIPKALGLKWPHVCSHHLKCNNE